MKAEGVMPQIEIGDVVDIPGDTQNYILTNPEKTYRGRVVGKGDGELIVRLDEPVRRGPGEFSEVDVREDCVRLVRSGHRHS